MYVVSYPFATHRPLTLHGHQGGNSSKPTTPLTRSQQLPLSILGSPLSPTLFKDFVFKLCLHPHPEGSFPQTSCILRNRISLASPELSPAGSPYAAGQPFPQHRTWTWTAGLQHGDVHGIIRLLRHTQHQLKSIRKLSSLSILTARQQVLEQ